MEDIYTHKTEVRKEIKELKKAFTESDIMNMSAKVMSTLEITNIFVEARNIFIYNSLKDEVQTIPFIKRWMKKKYFYFPVVVEDELRFQKYTEELSFTQSAIGIQEPVGEEFADKSIADLIIVPGIAFDPQKNRLGRGKGYYDHFLKEVKAIKVGICFCFQLLDTIPFDCQDVKMDYVIAENIMIE